jgi:peptidoglycan/LPS O-acetylase OafA/YrhL
MDSQFALAWNGPAWSISNEMFFYLCYPPSTGWHSVPMPVLFLCLSAASLLITTAWCDVNLASEDWHNLTSILFCNEPSQFALGVALGNLFIRGARTHLDNVGCWSRIPRPDTSVDRVVSVANEYCVVELLSVVFSLILFGAANRYTPVLSTRPLFILGDASYSIYILPVPIGSWWNHVTNVFWRLQLPPAVDFSLYLLSGAF